MPKPSIQQCRQRSDSGIPREVSSCPQAARSGGKEGEYVSLPL
jgi:hypothetical protein